MKLYIKYMVSISCKTIVISELGKLGVDYESMDLGAVEIRGTMTAGQLELIRIALSQSGLELMDDKRAILIEKIKNTIVEMIDHTEELPSSAFSDFLSQQLNHSYAYLAGLFSEVTGITIEHYIIALKIEQVKELLLYEGLNLTQISQRLHYSSVAYLSRQFKNVTGLTPTFFKQVKNKRLLMSGQI